jgi:hypothetical protein
MCLIILPFALDLQGLTSGSVMKSWPFDSVNVERMC